MKPLLRAIAIVGTASRYGLDEWLPKSRATPLLRVAKVFVPTSTANRSLPRGAWTAPDRA
ncbi:MAG: hypothetical protein ACK46K_01470 [Gammaproteobacteria bacterium]